MPIVNISGLTVDEVEKMFADALGADVNQLSISTKLAKSSMKEGE